MKNLLLTIWQLPQCLVAWVMMLFCPANRTADYNGVSVRYSDRMSGGISLGRYIILSNYYKREEWPGNTVKHEYGHTRQSLYLGWLYLLVIGLPSLVWAALYNGDEKGYYKFYTERWADKLGGVIR